MPTRTAAALFVLLLAFTSSAAAQGPYPSLDREPACQSLVPTAAGGPRPQNPDVIVLRFLGVANYELAHRDTVVLLDAGIDTLSWWESSGITPEMMTKDVDAILIGHAHGEHLWDAPYIGEKTGALVVADPLPLAAAASAAWVDKAGFGAEHVRSMEVDFPAGGKWRVARPSLEGDWKLTPLFAGEKLDVIRANSATYSLNRVEIADVAPGGLRPDQTGLDKPITVVAQTFDGLTYTLKLGELRGDNYYVTLWISGEPRPAGADAKERARGLAERLPHERALAGHVLLVARAKFEDVLKKRAELLEAKAAGKK